MVNINILIINFRHVVIFCECNNGLCELVRYNVIGWRICICVATQPVEVVHYHIARLYRR